MHKKVQVILYVLLLSTSWAQSIYKVDSLENALSRKNDPQTKMEILSQLSEVLISFDSDRALSYTQEVLEIAEIHNNHTYRMQAYLHLSEIYYNNTNHIQSMDFAYKAKNLAENLDRKKEYAETLILISKNYSDLGEYEKSADLNYQALDIFEDLNYKKGISKALSQIGNVYYELGNWDKAFEYDIKSLNRSMEINDSIGISRGLNNVATYYSSKGEIQDFKANLRKAITINKNIGHKLWEGTNYLNLGFIYLDQDSYDSAFFYFKRAELLFNELNHIPKLTEIYNLLSAYYSEMSNIEKSLHYAKEALKLGESNNLKKSVYEAAQLLHQLYIEQGDYINAYKYCLKEYKTKDSLNIDRGMTKLANLELLYKYDKIEEQKRNKQKQKEYIYFIIGTSIVFLLVIMVILLLNRRRIEKAKRLQLKAELNLKSKELTSNVVSLMRKNETLSEIADKLMKVRSEAVKEETKSAIVKIAKELQKTTEDDVWDEFEIRFKQVHGDFYDKLLERFPDLTPNELKICAFLRLNMTTKEISELTGQRVSSIEIARTRLRKKLGIGNTSVNLITFLSQI
jgi:tetratricopeptide (TPR) repeat protein